MGLLKTDRVLQPSFKRKFLFVVIDIYFLLEKKQIIKCVCPSVNCCGHASIYLLLNANHEGGKCKFSRMILI